MNRLGMNMRGIMSSVLLASLALSSTTTCKAGNIVVNQSFEQVDDIGVPIGWELGRPSNGCEAKIDLATAHSGKNSLLLEQTKAIQLPAGALEAPNLVKFLQDKKAGGFTIASQRVPVEAGKRYNFSFWYKAMGLQRENRDDLKRGYAAFQVHVFWMKDQNKDVDGKDARYWVLNRQVDSPDWAKVSNCHFNSGQDRPAYIAPEGAKFANIRFQLVTVAPEVTPKVWIDDVSLVDADVEDAGTSTVQVAIPNPGFEDGEGSSPKGWKTVGASTNKWTGETAHSGEKSVSVSDAGMGDFSGWAVETAVKSNCSYSFSGWIKGGDLSPNDFVGGGALCMQFLDKDGQIIGKTIISKAVPAKTDWTNVNTDKTSPPRDAVALRLIAGLKFCKGTAWFDDLCLTEEGGLEQNITMIRRDNPKPCEGITYAENLLANADVEEGDGEKPKGWTYVGKSDKDWNKDQILAFHREGRPDFRIGRGKGEWSRSTAYAGKGALLNISIDPPLSKNMQWYGRNPVDGYWLSDPMPCKSGKGYMASAWIRPGARISSAWYGPLEIRFYDSKGKAITAASQKEVIRPGLDYIPAGEWTFYSTLPYIAPVGAMSMRLRFGQELDANTGGWGKTYADNFALWECPATPEIQKIREMYLQPAAFRKWFHEAHAKIKPPYLPSPSEAQEYESSYGLIENTTAGNIFYNPQEPVKLKINVSNLIGESRKVKVKFERMDFLGKSDAMIEVPEFEVLGFSSGVSEFIIPPSNKYGTFYLEGKIMEGNALIGKANGRYAVLPKLERPHSVENIWAVTIISPKLYCDGRPYEKELGEMLRTAGFGIAWVKAGSCKGDELDEAFREVNYFNNYGIRSVLQLNHPQVMRPVDVAMFNELGKSVAEKFKGKVAAYGNWGIEQSNHRTEKQSVFRPIINGKMLSDEEYDQILAAIYDGIKSVDKDTPVLIGNIATDWDGDTVRRLYGKPGEGKFDGAILNAYMGILRAIEGNLKEFDKHGDTKKTVWQEECADQSSPIAGAERRYGEVEGAYNMVRTWLTVKCKGGTRVKAMTQWGFIGFDIGLVTDILQPRPQFAAHAVMADATADATFISDRSQSNVTIFEWKRGDGPMFSLWSNAGERSATFDVSSGKLTVMDVMGNRTEFKANDGIVSIKVSPAPIYVFGGGEGLKISNRIEAKLNHGSLKSGEPRIRLELKNNNNSPVDGKVSVNGPVEGEKTKDFNLASGESTTMYFPVKANLPTDSRINFSADFTTSKGAVYAANASLNFVQAVKTASEPALDGTWSGWKNAKTVEFGIVESQIYRPPEGKDHQYKGRDDICGKFRMMWDEQYFYLGVEAADDSFFPQPERGMNGFMGDSIEFAFQPDNNLARDAKYWEYELYLPNGQPPYAASRRFPLPAEMVSSWKATVKPTGTRGDCVYQAAIPWKDIGIEKPEVGKTFSFALILNDADPGERFNGGYRGRIRWFEGIDIGKNPQQFGDVTLVE